ncbi:MAG: VOC family protein [Myxococcales bacterium]|nr:VOC family protein [Myxococcales bacterium]
MSIKHGVPSGFHSITPHIVVKGAAAAIEFYKKAFGAEEISRLPGPGGLLMHAELRIGDTPLWLADENPAFGLVGPGDASAVTLNLYVSDADKVYGRALEAGAKTVQAPEDTFWGDRYSRVKDPFGHNWAIATRTREVTPEDMAKAMQNMPK